MNQKIEKTNFKTKHENLEPPTPWLLKPFLAEGETLLIIGDRWGEGSSLALDMALCLASGKQFLSYETTKVDSVAFVSWNNKQWLQSLVDMWKKYNKEEQPPNFVIYEQYKEFNQEVLDSVLSTKPDVVVLDTWKSFESVDYLRGKSSVMVLHPNWSSSSEELEEPQADCVLTLLDQNEWTIWGFPLTEATSTPAMRFKGGEGV